MSTLLTVTRSLLVTGGLLLLLWYDSIFLGIIMGGILGWDWLQGLVFSYQTNLNEKVPAMDKSKMRTDVEKNDLHTMSAREVVNLLKTKVVTPQELIDVVEARIAEMEPHVHATPITCFDRARAAASEMEKDGHKDQGPGYLYGLPVLIKDLSAVKGVKFTRGCKYHEHNVAQTTDPVVEQLEAMGGIVVGKTNTPEYGMGGATFNEVFPTTVVPPQLHRTHPVTSGGSSGGAEASVAAEECWQGGPLTSGGSSGGSAAALASQECWLATGSDLGGSLRTPAAFCGVVGFRVSADLMPWSDPEIIEQELHGIQGPMARTVPDLALFLDALAPKNGKSWQDIAEDGVNSKFHVAFSTLGCPVSQEVEELCRAAADRLDRDGAATLVRRPFDVDKAQEYFHWFRTHRLQDKANWPGGNKELFKPETQWNLSIANSYQEQKSRENVLESALELLEEVKKFFNDPDGYDILAVPTTLDGAFDATMRYPVSGFGQSTQDFSNYLSWLSPVCLISMTNCPALSLPVAKLADGRNVGLQLIAAPQKDAAVLAAAAALEAQLATSALPPATSTAVADTASRTAEGPRTVDEARMLHQQNGRWTPLEWNSFQVDTNC